MSIDLFVCSQCKRAENYLGRAPKGVMGADDLACFTPTFLFFHPRSIRLRLSYIRKLVATAEKEGVPVYSHFSFSLYLDNQLQLAFG